MAAKTYSNAQRNAAAWHLTMAKLAKLYGPNDAKPVMLMAEEAHRSAARLYVSTELAAARRRRAQV